MKHIKIFLLGGMLLLNGCTTYRYIQVDKTENERQKDWKECHYEAEKAAASLSIRSEYTRMTRVNSLHQMCMELRGYKKVKQ